MRDVNGVVKDVNIRSARANFCFTMLAGHIDERKAPGFVESRENQGIDQRPEHYDSSDCAEKSVKSFQYISNSHPSKSRWKD